MNKTILRLAIPNILSNLSVPLLGIVDTALMGRMESEIYIGAIALGSILFNFLYWGFGFLRMGTTGLTAQAFGKRNKEESALILGRAFLVSLVGSGLMIVLQRLIGEGGFLLIEGEEAVKELAKEYFYIRIYAAPATIGLYAIHGWFLGMQNARFPMFLTIVVNAINIALNFLFVFQFGMKSDGVALATVLAQYAGLVFAFGLFYYRYRSFLAHLRWKRILDLPGLRHFFSVNSDIFIRTICLIFTLAFFTNQSSDIDPIILAANTILMQFYYMVAYGVDGFAFAAESLVGRFTGAKDDQQLRTAIRLLFIWGGGIAIVFSIIFLGTGDQLLYIFTDQPAVISATRPYLIWMILVSFVASFAFIWDGIYIGATATRAMRNTMMFATLLIFLPTYYLAAPGWGNHGLWLAMLVFMIARTLSLTFLANKEIFTKSLA